MRESIEKIIEIDERTRQIEKQTDQELENLRKETTKELSEMENRELELAKKEADKSFDEILKCFDQRAEEIAKAQSDDLQSRKELYGKLEPKILDEAFEIVFGERSDR